MADSKPETTAKPIEKPQADEVRLKTAGGVITIKRSPKAAPYAIQQNN